MAFKHTSLIKDHKNHLRNTFRYLTMFFLGMSIVLFSVKAFNIAPIAPNAIIYIKTIFLTQSGSNTSTTGIILEGSGGNAWFQGDITIGSLPAVSVLGTDSSGKIISSQAQSVYNLISGYLATGSSFTGYRSLSGSDISNANAGNVGIGTDTPAQVLQVSGNIVGGSPTNKVIGTYSAILGGGENNERAIYSTIVGGFANMMNEGVSYGFIGGGSGNKIGLYTPQYSVIVGGAGNYSEGDDTFIGGGMANLIFGGGSSIVGGNYNILTGMTSSIVGGSKNSVNGAYAFVGGGKSNKGYGTGSSVVGGENNSTDQNSVDSIIGGGNTNVMEYASSSVIGGGIQNAIKGKSGKMASPYNMIGGGGNNSIGDSAAYNTIGGGGENSISGAASYNIILGGRKNSIDIQSEYNIVGGYGNAIYAGSSYGVALGTNNILSANNGFAFGSGAVVRHFNTFVWNSAVNLFSSSRSRSFLINAPFDSGSDYGGVGINTPNPQAALDVSGDIRTNSEIHLVGSGIERRMRLSGEHLIIEGNTGAGRMVGNGGGSSEFRIQ